MLIGDRSVFEMKCCGEDIRWLIWDCSIIDEFVHDRFYLLDLHRSRSIRPNSFVDKWRERIQLRWSTISTGMTKKRISSIRFDATIGMARSIFTSLCSRWKKHLLFGFFFFRSTIDSTSTWSEKNRIVLIVFWRGIYSIFIDIFSMEDVGSAFLDQMPLLLILFLGKCSSPLLDGNEYKHHFSSRTKESTRLGHVNERTNDIDRGIAMFDESSLEQKCC